MDFAARELWDADGLFYVSVLLVSCRLFSRPPSSSHLWISDNCETSLLFLRMGPLLFSRSILLRLFTAIYCYGRGRRSSSRLGGAVNSSPNRQSSKLAAKYVLACRRSGCAYSIRRFPLSRCDLQNPHDTPRLFVQRRHFLTFTFSGSRKSPSPRARTSWRHRQYLLFQQIAPLRPARFCAACRR